MQEYFFLSSFSLLSMRKTYARPQTQSIWIQALQLDHSYMLLSLENFKFASWAFFKLESIYTLSSRKKKV